MNDEQIVREALTAEVHPDDIPLEALDALDAILHREQELREALEQMEGALRELVEAEEGRMAIHRAGSRNTVGVASPALSHAAMKRSELALAAARRALSTSEPENLEMKP